MKFSMFNRDPNIVSRVIVATGCLLLLTAPVASALEGRDSGKMMNLVRPVAQTVEDSVVQVLSGGVPVGLGTVVSEDGYLLTKRSELSGDPIRIRLGDDRLLPARVAAVRRDNDLALLRVESEVDFKPIHFASKAPAVASFLISAGRGGRPIGIGVIGAPQRRINHRGRLGVHLSSDSTGRARVFRVHPRSGADLAGIVPGDLIVAINGHEETSREAVISTLHGMYPGENVRLTILRPGAGTKMDTLEMDAGISELGVLEESENDSKVNGPRNVRLSGFDSVIQHDTVLDPDECGGPVLDSNGRCVGINIARAGRVVSYALPASLVMTEMVSMLEEARASQ